jgi:hypothetical protein
MRKGHDQASPRNRVRRCRRCAKGALLRMPRCNLFDQQHDNFSFGCPPRNVLRTFSSSPRKLRTEGRDGHKVGRSLLLGKGACSYPTQVGKYFFLRFRVEARDNLNHGSGSCSALRVWCVKAVRDGRLGRLFCLVTESGLVRAPSAIYC